MASSKITMKRHDTRPFLDVKLKDDENAYADLTISGIGVTFTMKNAETDAVKIDAQSCEIVLPDEGGIRYVWQDGDTDEAAAYLGEFEVTYPSDPPYPDAKTTYPVNGTLVIVILEDYDNA